MPKCFSQQEREYIKTRLQEEAASCLAQYGVKKTTVDEIVKRVNIPKGTFYLFYNSKELLLFEVILQQHEMIENQMYEAISHIDITNIKKNLTDLIINFFNIARNLPMIKVLTSNEIDILVRKLPPEVITNHLGHDVSMLDRAFSALPIKPNIDSASFSAAFRALFFATIHRDEIGKDEYNKALYLLVNGLVSQMF